ncbi:MAG: hypothetical protein AB7O60_01955 [Variibacter sp.]
MERFSARIPLQVLRIDHVHYFGSIQNNRDLSRELRAEPRGADGDAAAHAPIVRAVPKAAPAARRMPTTVVTVVTVMPSTVRIAMTILRLNEIGG